MKSFFSFLAFWALGLSFSGLAAQCPACTIQLPSGMPNDTIYLDSFPDAQQNQYYEANLSFRLPYTTAPLRALDPSISFTVSLQSFTILGITGLPLGMTWVADRPVPAVYNETSPNTRDGCVTLCGRPIQADSFTILISVEVNAGALGLQYANIPISFYVAPDSGAAIRYNPATGCAPLSVEFSPRVLPQNNQQAQYFWDFGNGQTANQAMVQQVYSDTGLYEVSYFAEYVLPIPRTFLHAVSITQAPCNDNVTVLGVPIPGAPDIFLTIGTVNGPIDTVTASVDNRTPSVAQPVVFMFGQSLPLRAGEQVFIEVKDDDTILGAFPSSDNCGVLSFASDTLLGQVSPIILNLSNGSLSLTLRIDRDTVYLRDTFEARELVYVEDCVASVDNLSNSELAWRVFPNPARGRFTVEADLGLSPLEGVSFRLYDVLGRQVWQVEAGANSGLNQWTWDIGADLKGWYILEIQGAQGRAHQKIRLD